MALQPSVLFFLCRCPLPFGGPQQLYSFNRVSRSLHHLLCKLLWCPCTCFYDDFPTVSPSSIPEGSSKQPKAKHREPVKIEAGALAAQRPELPTRSQPPAPESSSSDSSSASSSSSSRPKEIGMSSPEQTQESRSRKAMAGRFAESTDTHVCLTKLETSVFMTRPRKDQEGYCCRHYLSFRMLCITLICRGAKQRLAESS